MVSAVLCFPGEKLATFTCSFGAQNINQYQLVGTEGILYAEPAYDYKNALQWTIRRGPDEERKTFAKGDQFAAEMDYFSRCSSEPQSRER